MSIEDTHHGRLAPDDNPFIVYSDNASSDEGEYRTSTLQFLRSSPQTREHLYRQIHEERSTWQRTITEKNFTIRTLRTEIRGHTAAHAATWDRNRTLMQELDVARGTIARYEATFGPNPGDDGSPDAASVEDARNFLSIFPNGMLSSLHIFAAAVWSRITRTEEEGVMNKIQALLKRVEELEYHMVADERVDQMELDIENILCDGRLDRLEFDVQEMEERLHTLESR